MATQVFRASEILGFTPAVDPRLSDKVFALSGQNYIFDSLGPHSAFGNRILIPQPWDKPQYSQGFRVHLRAGDRAFHMNGDGIWEWDEGQGGYVCVYPTPDTSIIPSRWTCGYLAGIIYFCHPMTGILGYNTITGYCAPHSKMGGLGTPSNAQAIVVNSGRLCVMDPLFFSWSSPSDGLDFTPTLGGGGFQLISDLVSGNPIMITSYTGGCLTWTSGGVLRSEFTGDSTVYRHRPLNTEYKPVNSFCSARVDDDTVIILDERGLFKSGGDAPSAYSAIFNEFLITYIRKNKLNVGENLRLEWDELNRLMYISVSFNSSSPQYDMAFVYYPPLDKWGQFNESHFGILPVNIDISSRSGTYYGYIDTDGRTRYWADTASREIRYEDRIDIDDTNLYYSVIQRIAEPGFYDTGTVMPSVGKLSGFSRIGMNSRASYYDLGNLTPTLSLIEGLDSNIRMGLFRPTGSSAADELSEVLGIQISSYDSDDAITIETPTNNSPIIDLENSSPDVDMGLDIPDVVGYSISIVGTLDGKTDFLRQTPSLVQFTRSTRYYSCSVTGVWHIVEIGAADIGESYQIQTLEITATTAGRLL